MEEAPVKMNPAAILTDDLVIEILRRLPIRSICCMKRVSRFWRKLISDPDHRKKLPQTLTGFFYASVSGERFHYTTLDGKGEPFNLPFPSDNVELLDSRNGLLLFRCSQSGPGKVDAPFHYAVCNPTTSKWVMCRSLASGQPHTALLGFDPAVSSHFHVVEYVMDEGREWVAGGAVTGVQIYSSKTASWNFKGSEWGANVYLHIFVEDVRSVFLDGFMHVMTLRVGIVVVDMEGTTWRTIPVPSVPSDGQYGCINQTQGRLCFVNVHDADALKLSIWILEDHGTNEWTLKHSVRTPLLFPEKNPRLLFEYTVITVHPECNNLIYFVYGRDNTLMAYEMDHKEIHVICNLGHHMLPCLSYVPLFSEALADEP